MEEEKVPPSGEGKTEGGGTPGRGGKKGEGLQDKLEPLTKGLGPEEGRKRSGKPAETSFTDWEGRGAE